MKSLITFTALASSLFTTHLSGAEIDELAKRVLGDKASHFSFESLNGKPHKDAFNVHAKDDKVAISGTSAVAQASALNWYLKHSAHCHISWNGDQLKLPSPLPDATYAIESPYEHGFYFNYCTFSYTMAWWDWERWEREIDYMALCGIDMPLAIVGTEAIWYNFLTRFGYSDKEAKAFICGPGYNAWWLMGNMEGKGGPITQGWIDSRIELQKKILQRMRDLGMRPVLPGFVGIVPSDMDKKIKSCKLLPQGKWAGNHVRPAVLHPESPQFDEMAQAWYEEVEKLYGRCDAFSGDLFHEGGKTHGINVSAYVKRVQEHMLDYNPEAIWTIQAWGHNPSKDLLNQLRDKNTLVIDLCNEFWRNWEKNQNFWGKPWAFSTIIMYGGNVAMHGRLDNITNNLNAALAQKNPPKALSATWESIEVNPVVMDYLWDMRWRKEAPDPKEWVEDYTRRRYGAENGGAINAWEILIDTAYGSHPGLRRPQESIFCALPSKNVKKASPFAATIKVHYDQIQLLAAVEMFHNAAAVLGDQETYRYDLVDMTRQFLANAGQVAYKKMMTAFHARNKKAFREYSQAFLQMMKDQDELLGTHKQFMVGPWLHDAMAQGDSAKQSRQNERAARLLISTWTEQQTNLDNYAWREWNGMIGRYYLPQWEAFIKQLEAELNGKASKKSNYFEMRKHWAEQTWQQDSYPTKPIGDPIETSGKILQKWGAWLSENYQQQSEGIKPSKVIGTWEYPAAGNTWRRVLSKDGSLSLYKNGTLWTLWDGFSWKIEGDAAVLYRKDGSQFATMRIDQSGKAIFSEGYKAVRVETGKNTEAEEAANQ